MAGRPTQAQVQYQPQLQQQQLQSSTSPRTNFGLVRCAQYMGCSRRVSPARSQMATGFGTAGWGTAITAPSAQPTTSPHQRATLTSVWETLLTETLGLTPDRDPVQAGEHTSLPQRGSNDREAAGTQNVRVDSVDSRVVQRLKKRGDSDEACTHARDVLDAASSKLDIDAFEARLGLASDDDEGVAASAGAGAGAGGTTVAAPGGLRRTRAGSSAPHQGLAWSSDAPRLAQLLAQEAPKLPPGAASRYTRRHVVLGMFRDLRLPNSGIDALDAGVAKFRNLVELTVAGNAVDHLDPACLPRKLQALHAYACRIATVGPATRCHRGLVCLGVAYNPLPCEQLSAISTCFPGLQVLDLAGCHIRNLATAVGALGGRLPALQYLNMSSTPVSLCFGYRRALAQCLPSLVALDDIVISMEAREAWSRDDASNADGAQVHIQVAIEDVVGLPTPAAVAMPEDPAAAPEPAAKKGGKKGGKAKKGAKGKKVAGKGMPCGVVWCGVALASTCGLTYAAWLFMTHRRGGTCCSSRCHTQVHILLSIRASCLCRVWR